ncbi:ABC transporter ATP-binding protein [Desulfurococcus mucosus]|uniref:Oligopeptide/dipeptide ABC transporter, ATPase subunit n=1 Tax=Desulfurococcus mucosus (strain ATCC 35584 / DSM 2162 / JCM 9187 / O7/1) TaxID=765177 RepID=E8R9T9_DESM0|nr:ABC transporter ATP-binding protein [Desulfurococcus mucosus]ADV65265.1 oligopeptide/dipeptide ABC transporter, ATPase subunit [Desulfurococcus mucosus DSM 2162]
MVLAVKAMNLWIGYMDEGEIVHWAVRGISFQVDEGEIYCLVGESGCGKSTTGNAIAGILPSHAVTRGELYIYGRKVIDDDRVDYRGVRGRLVSYIPQNPGTSLNPYETVENQFYYVLNSIYGYSREKALETARRYLSMVELDPERVLDHYPHELSGGMQQRVAIGIALATGARVVVADEPTSSLDAHLRLQLIKLIRRLRDEQGLSVILITHDLVSAGRICDVVGVMYAGKIIEEGKGSLLLTEPLHPYTQMLVDAVPILGLKKPLKSIPGEPPRAGGEIRECVFRDRCPQAFDKCVTHPPESYVMERKISCWRYTG